MDLIKNPYKLITYYKLKLYRKYIKKYKQKPKREGFIYVFKDIKTKKHKRFEKGVKLLVYSYRIVKVKKKLPKKIKLPKGWQQLSHYFYKFIEKVKKDYEDYDVKFIDKIYHNDFFKDVIHLKTKYIFKYPVRLPRRLLSKEKLVRKYGYRNHYLLRFSFAYANTKTKKIFIHTRNAFMGEEGVFDFDKLRTWKQMQELKDKELWKIYNKLLEFDYIEFIDEIGWTSYIFLDVRKRKIIEGLHYEKNNSKRVVRKWYKKKP